jgi:lysylphosphatidylglycerol synthetase-like protein (DUF2156 family)
MVHLEANDGAAAFYLLFVLTAFITCLTPVVVARAAQRKFTKGFWVLAATVVGAGAVCWSIHPTAVEWANASATFEPHEILGVAWDVSERALRSAYRRLALEHHPDKGGDPVRFQLIVTAYEALMNRLHGNPDF